MPDFEHEDGFNGLSAGVDEAGVGPWAGPVVAAAVIINRDFCPAGVNDSKKLDKETREELYNEITRICDYGVGVISVKIIDRVNIYNATQLAMRNAVHSLPKKPQMLLIDGRHKMRFQRMQVRSIVKGDGKSFSIAAASIITKVTRDRIMTELHNDYPHYNWHTNAGYGTKAHQEALKNHGICRHHRKSYAPIKAYLVNEG